MKGTTRTGFEFEIKDEALDDYELLEVLHKVDAGSYGYITEVLEKLLGEEQKNALKEHLRAKEGKISSKAMIAEIAEMLKSCKELKNC